MADLSNEVDGMTVAQPRVGADREAALAAWQCPFQDGITGLAADEYGNQFCAMERRAKQAEADADSWKNSAVHQNGVANAALEENDRLRARVAELEKERAKDHAEINLKADFIEATINQSAADHARIAELVGALGDLILAASNFHEAANRYLLESEYELDAGLGNSEAHLTVIVLPAARAALAKEEPKP